MIDIVERLRFDAVRCEVQFSKGVAGNITEGADEIERLRKTIEKIKSGRSEDPQLDALRTLGQRPVTDA
jgi:hypothetical protein